MRETLSDCGRLPGDGSQPPPQALGVEQNDAGCPSSGSRSKLVSLAGKLGTEPRESDSGHETGISSGAASSAWFDHTPRIITCEGKEYYVPVMVHCSPVAVSTVWLDFFVHHDEFTVVRGRRFDELLRERKVLQRELPDETWRVVPRTNLRLIHMKDKGKTKGKTEGKTKTKRLRKSATLVRVKVDRKCSIAFGRETSESNRYSWGEQSSGKNVVIRNCSEKTIMVVQTPTGSTTGPGSSDTCPFEVRLGEESSSSAWKSDTRTTTITLPAGYEPACKVMAPREMCEFKVAELGETTRLIFCTLEDLPDTGEVPGMGLPTEDSQSVTMVTPLSEVNAEGCKVKMLRVWDSMLAYGGRDIGVLPAFSTGFYLQSATVYGSDALYLAHCAIALDGNFTPATHTTDAATAPSIITVQGLKREGPWLSILTWLLRKKMNE